MPRPFTFDLSSPLDRMPDESRKANEALHDYWRMGPARSLKKQAAGYRGEYARGDDWFTLFAQYVHQADTGAALKPPTRQERTLAGWSSRYAWQARVDRLLVIDRAKEAAAWEEERLQWRERRRRLLQAFYGKTLKALSVMEMSDDMAEKPSLGALTNAVRTVTTELRAEYDDEPTHRLAVGEGEEKGVPQHVSQEIDLSEMTDDELDTVDAIAERLQERSQAREG